MSNYLITQRYLLEKTAIKEQKEAKDLARVFYQIEEIYIKDLVGIPLFEKLKAHVNEEAPLTDAEQQLFDKVQYYFALMVEWDLSLSLFEITNKSLQVEGNAPSLEAVKLKRAELLFKADHIKTTILNLLTDSAFVDYFPATAEKPIRQSISGLVFDTSPRIVFGR